ncbi:hypothetical protein NC653_034186 [Populus alba x Populus x berolinensis]|uniref:Uncharacterized protein n=1 Tax=Populus alba x Populus x berolinensis TaxID=444605 RepID=A0AAD6LMB7_9ROSI|nr:hypothetical protein NC653_034186 [Populus alba x Populus x berolinensis]
MLLGSDSSSTRSRIVTRQVTFYQAKLSSNTKFLSCISPISLSKISENAYSIRLTGKVDVCSYGVFLFELVFRKLPPALKKACISSPGQGRHIT